MLCNPNRLPMPISDVSDKSLASPGCTRVLRWTIGRTADKLVGVADIGGGDCGGCEDRGGCVATTNASSSACHHRLGLAF